MTTDATKPRIIYRVKNWDDFFEGAKSKTYNNKTSCMMPTKHGLGFRRLIAHESGPALFGAWCAMIQVISRHPKPRQGYLTDTGRIQGFPLTENDLESLTGIPATIYAEMIRETASHRIAWLEHAKVADTAGISWGGDNSDSDSNLDSNLNSTSLAADDVNLLLTGAENRQTVIDRVSSARPEYRRIARAMWESAIKVNGLTDELLTQAANAFIQADANRTEPLKAPARYFARVVEGVLHENGVETETMEEMIARRKRERGER